VRPAGLTVADPERTATVFLSMVVSGPVRIIVSGNRLTRREMEDHLQFAIRLFLEGAMVRS
jgi:TetR/AcrR family transcriptional repressor of mexJK operon